MYDRILVPTDGSATAQRAVDHALSVAERFDAEVRAIFIVDEGLFETPLAGRGLDQEELLSDVEERGRAFVEQVAEAAASRGIDAKGILRRDKEIARGILGNARDADVDLIVMGTHGRSGLQRFLLGSVAERVLRGADMPVVLVPPGEEPDEETG